MQCSIFDYFVSDVIIATGKTLSFLMSNHHSHMAGTKERCEKGAERGIMTAYTCTPVFYL